MRKVIDRKVYDTDKAEVIASYYSTYDRNDFSFVWERVFITRKGSYFLHGEGGPTSKYRQETIEPLCREEVFEWLQKRNEIELIEVMFPELIEEA